MPVLLAFLEELKATRQADLGTAAAWKARVRTLVPRVGTAAARGLHPCPPPPAPEVQQEPHASSGPGRSSPRFGRPGNTVSWMVLDALEGRRHLHEVDAEAHRCAKFFFTLVEGKNAEIVTRAICANVENELGLALSQAEVAAWLGKSTAGVQPA